MTTLPPHPMQPVYLDDEKVLRFRHNAIVEHLLAHSKIDLNQIAMLDFSQEDREQFAQLLGYSVRGYHELSYVSDESAAQASALAGEVVPGAGGCRDAGCSVHGGPLFDDDGRRIT
jgi:hypothetical protein